MNAPVASVQRGSFAVASDVPGAGDDGEVRGWHRHLP